MACGNHPDFLAVSPAEDKLSISIEQIRALIEHVWLTTQYGGYKVVVVNPAERMTRQAANTLLKTLEEPPGAAVLIVVTHQSGLLPATIRSRCQMLDFPLPLASRALPWLSSRLPQRPPAETLLRLADGAPFGALEIAEAGGAEARSDLFRDLVALAAEGADPVAVADGWRGKEVPEVGRWLTTLTMDLIRLKSDQNSPALTHEDLRKTMQPVARRLDLIRLFALLDVCLELRWLCDRQTSFNPQLLLEDVAIRFAAAGRACT
jgi:DNA polymerase-3 subunit delta'